MYEEFYCAPNTLVEDYLYKIGMFAQMNRITVKTLRFYEEQGLLKPAKIDEETGYRYYTMSQMEPLHRIHALKDDGFKIEEIKQLNNCNDEESFLRYKKNEILSKIAELTAQLSKIEGFIAGGKASIDTPVILRKIPEVMCATMKVTIDSYEDLFSCMPKMGVLMEESVVVK